MRSRHFSRVTVVVVAALLGSALWSRAQPLADHLPGDTLIYVGWRGADSMGPGYAGSHLKAVLDASDFSQIVDEFIPGVLTKIGHENREAGEMLPIVAAIGRPMWKHPSALYFGGVDLGGPEPMPRLAVLCDAGADAPQLVATLKNLVAKAQGGPPIEVKEAKGLVAVTVGKMSTGFDAAFGGGGATLSADKAFADAMAQVGKEPSIAAYVNFEGILAAADQLVNQMAPPEAKAMWPKIRDGLGLGGLKRIIYTGGFDGKDWMDAAFVAAPAPRTGLLKMAESMPMPADALKVAPKSSTYVAAAHLNLAGLVAGLREGIRQFDAGAGQQIDAVLGQVSQALGMDVQKDLLGSLGDQWVVYTDPNTGGFGFAGTVIVNKLADPAKAEQSCSRLEQFLNQILAANLQEEKMTVAFQTRQSPGGLTLHYLAVPLVTPTWAIRDGNLYMALYPQPVTVAADFVAHKGPSILENESYIALRKRLGVDDADGIQFSDLPRVAPTSYGQWLAISRLVGFGDLVGIKSPLMLMPPMDKLLAELGPAGSVSWQDAAGFHLKSLSPFPGSTILATDPLAAYMSSAGPALSLSILLPSLSKARESANRVKSASNLRQIGQGVLLYANENNGACPPDLGTILMKEDLTAEAFISPRSGKSVPPQLRAMTPEQQAQWVEQNTDYVYLGKGKKAFGMKPDEPLAYEKFEAGGGQGINILFGDGHVEWMSMPDAMRVVGEKPKLP